MIQGSCLCGDVRWQFDAEPDGATACNCTACRRYGVLWAYDYEDEAITVSGRTQAYVPRHGPRVPLLPGLRLRRLLALAASRPGLASSDRAQPSSRRA